MDSNIATQRKGPGGKKLRTDSFEKCITKLSAPAVVLEELSNESSNELSNEMVPDLPDCSLKVEDETQTDFTDQEAYLREIIDMIWSCSFDHFFFFFLFLQFGQFGIVSVATWWYLLWLVVSQVP